jgi:hypothetical protein
MTAKSSVQDAAKHEVHTSPFEQITTIENEQEARVQHAAERFENEKRESEKLIAGSEKTQEEMMRSQATDELKEYARTEPENILKTAEKESTAEIAAIRNNAEKQLPKALETILTPVLDGSLFTTAA